MARYENPSGRPHGSLWKYLKTRRNARWHPWPTWVDSDPGPTPPPRVETNKIRATVLNHSTVLIQSAGLNIITDPIYSERCSPVSFAGPKRVRQPGIPFDELPPIHLVLVSHDHYDHLDRPTLRRLAERDAPAVVTGLGVARHLPDRSKATELDWWESHAVAPGVTVHFLPTEHFSGRTPFDRNTTRWGAFLIDVQGRLIYFGADTGYGPHFRATHERFGPVSLAFLPIGAYAPQDFMGPVHMNPTEAVRAHQDLEAGRSVAIHYGTFRLAAEPIFEPASKLAKALDAAGLSPIDFLAPEFGTPIILPALRD